MKKDIHPKYYPKAKIKCVCGAVFEIGSTKPEIDVEICSQCHPFYTGKERVIKTGQVERFRQRLAKKKNVKPNKKSPDARSESRLKRRRGKVKIKKEGKPASAKALAGKKNG